METAITIIIPTYNRAWSLPKAIESCKSDTLPLQVIVVDDGSTDTTWDLLLKTPGIEIYREEHWGKPWAVNMAFAHAKGKYVKFFDSDDWLVPGILEAQYNLAEQENADIVVSGYSLFDDEQHLLTQEWIYSDDFIAQNLGESDSSSYTAFLFKKEFINDIPHRTSFASANFASRDDRCFMLEAALKEPKVAIYKQAGICIRHHQKGRLQFQKRMAATCTDYQHLLIYKNILKQLANTGRLTKRRIDAAINILWPLCHWIAKSDIYEANEVYKWILELNPQFKIPKGGIVNIMYHAFGFKKTEQILSLRRQLKY